jgi:hypothetical protein
LSAVRIYLPVWIGELGRTSIVPGHGCLCMGDRRLFRVSRCPHERVYAQVCEHLSDQHDHQKSDCSTAPTWVQTEGRCGIMCHEPASTGAGTQVESRAATQPQHLSFSEYFCLPYIAKLSMYAITLSFEELYFTPASLAATSSTSGSRAVQRVWEGFGPLEMNALNSQSRDV